MSDIRVEGVQYAFHPCSPIEEIAVRGRKYRLIGWISVLVTETFEVRPVVLCEDGVGREVVDGVIQR